MLNKLSYYIATQLSAFFPDKEFVTGHGKAIINILGYDRNVKYRWSIRRKNSTDTLLITSIDNLDLYSNAIHSVADSMIANSVQYDCDCVALSDTLKLSPDIVCEFKACGIERVDL